MDSGCTISFGEFYLEPRVKGQEGRTALRKIVPVVISCEDCCHCSVSQLCPTFCDPMDYSLPGFPVLHYLPELTQTHVHWVGDAIQLSHLLLLPFPPAFNLSHDQGLFQWITSLHQVAKVLELQLQLQSFQWIFRVDFILDCLVWSPCSPRDSQESSLTP